MNTNRWIGVAAAALLAGAWTAAAQVQGTLVLKGDVRREGLLRWKSTDKGYDVRTGSGVQTFVPIAQVEDVEIKTPPAGLDEAIRNVQAGRYASAIPVLRQIAADYQMLKYDVPAARWLAAALRGNGQPKEAVAALERLTRDNPNAMQDGGVAGELLEALIADNQLSRAMEQIGITVAEGSREAAAAALLKRGDLEARRNNFQRALEDGYLRVIVLFEEAHDLQPEALFMAAKCFDQLAQPAYAERMRKKLLQDYPQSTWAEKIKAGG